jgi:hypothetical protein
MNDQIVDQCSVLVIPSRPPKHKNPSVKTSLKIYLMVFTLLLRDWGGGKIKIKY